MPTKSANGGTLFCIKNGINYKLRPDLNINKDKKLESIEIKNWNESTYRNYYKKF